MNSKRLFYVLAGSVALLTVGIFAGVYGANSLLQGAAKKVLDAKSQSAALDQQHTRAAKAKADVEKYRELGSIAKSIVPQDKDQAQTVRQLVRIAADNGVIISNITFPGSTLGAGAAGGAAGATAPTPAAGGTSTALSQLIAVPAISGVYSLNISLESEPTKSVPFDKFLNFLNDLEHNRRTALVTGISITPDPKKAGNVSFTLNLQEYVKP